MTTLNVLSSSPLVSNDTGQVYNGGGGSSGPSRLTDAWIGRVASTNVYKLTDANALAGNWTFTSVSPLETNSDFAYDHVNNQLLLTRFSEALPDDDGGDGEGITDTMLWVVSTDEGATWNSHSQSPLIGASPSILEFSQVVRYNGASRIVHAISYEASGHRRLGWAYIDSPYTGAWTFNSTALADDVQLVLLDGCYNVNKSEFLLVGYQDYGLNPDEPRLYISTDNGVTFTDQSARLSGLAAAARVETGVPTANVAVGSIESDGTGNLVLNLMVRRPIGVPSQLGRMAYSSDDGVTWTYVPALDIGAFGTFPSVVYSSDVSRFYACSDGRQLVYSSNDAGVTWSPVTGTVWKERQCSTRDMLPIGS